MHFWKVVNRTATIFVIGTILAANSPSAEADKVSPRKIKKLRHEAAARQRRIVFHSDGMTMHPSKVKLEGSTRCKFPFLPGTKTDACTYSLIHQFPVVRLYRSKVGQEWPKDAIEQLYGDGPDGLDIYIDFCRKNGYESFWAMRTNDTHDADGDPNGLERWKSNPWKQNHLELLVGTREKRPPYARWSAYDYAQPAVRDKVYNLVAEVCENYEVDGIFLDFFRHPPTFKSTAWGNDATQAECDMLTNLLRRLLIMRDKMGARRGRPILLAVRTPDSAAFSKALGQDIETWMRRGLVDIWIAGGYYRMQDWEKSVEMAHKYKVPIWASIDDSRITERKDRNSLEIYRARVMNAWRAGVDAVFLFNFFYEPDHPQFKVLHEGGSAEQLAETDKTYVLEPRNVKRLFNYFFKNAQQRFLDRPKVFTPNDPITLTANNPLVVSLRVGDDVGLAHAKGSLREVTLGVQTGPGAELDALRVNLNKTRLKNPIRDGDWIQFAINPSLLKKGANEVAFSLQNNHPRELLLRDLQLSIKYSKGEH